MDLASVRIGLFLGPAFTSDLTCIQESFHYRGQRNGVKIDRLKFSVEAEIFLHMFDLYFKTNDVGLGQINKHVC